MRSLSDRQDRYPSNAPQQRIVRPCMPFLAHPVPLLRHRYSAPPRPRTLYLLHGTPGSVSVLQSPIRLAPSQSDSPVKGRIRARARRVRAPIPGAKCSRTAAGWLTKLRSARAIMIGPPRSLLLREATRRGRRGEDEADLDARRPRPCEELDRRRVERDFGILT